jgi:hypothetical protein
LVPLFIKGILSCISKAGPSALKEALFVRGILKENF